MFDDIETAEQKTEASSPDADGEDRSSQLYRWAHFPAFAVGILLFFLFHRYPWRWQVAIGGSYTVYVFFFAFGSVISDADDFFGDPRMPRYAARLLLAHLPILALVLCGVTLWFYLRPMLPDWVTHEGRKGSFWMLLGFFALIAACLWEGSWMAGKIKERFPESENSPQ
jgi:hypothetical protein